MVAGVRPGGADHQRDHMAVEHERTLLAFIAAVDRPGAGDLATPRGPDDHTVDNHRVGDQLVRMCKAAIATPRGCGAMSRPPPTHGAGGRWYAGATEFRWNVFPSCTGSQEEPDHLDDTVAGRL